MTSAKPVEEIARELMDAPCVHQGAGYTGIWLKRECHECLTAALRIEREAREKAEGALLEIDRLDGWPDEIAATAQSIARAYFAREDK